MHCSTIIYQVNIEGNIKNEKVSRSCSYSMSFSSGPDVLGNTLINHKLVPHPMGREGTLALECETEASTGALGLGSMDRQHGRQADGCLEIQQNTYRNEMEELVAVQ